MTQPTQPSLFPLFDFFSRLTDDPNDPGKDPLALPEGLLNGPGEMLFPEERQREFDGFVIDELGEPDPLATPRKRRRLVKESSLPYLRNVNEVRHKILSKEPILTKIENNEVELSGFEKIGSGSYYDAYRVSGSDGNVYVVKILNHRCRTTMGDEEILSMLESEFRIYKQFRKIFDGISNGRIATFYNFQPFEHIENDQITEDWVRENLNSGMHVVEYVEGEYPIDAGVGSRQDLTDEQRSADEQLKEMFKLACSIQCIDSKGMPFSLDVQRPNVRLDQKNKIVLIDPADPQSAKYYLLAKKHLKSFAPEGSERFKFLDPRTK